MSNGFLVRSATISVSVVLLLIIFRPFSLRLESRWHLYIYFGLGLVIFTTLHINHHVFRPLIQRLPVFRGKQAWLATFSRCWYFAVSVVVVFYYFSFFQTQRGNDHSTISLWVKVTLVTILAFIANYLIQNRSSLQKQVTDLEGNLLKIDGEDVILLQSKNGKDNIQLRKKDLLYIRAEDNYVSIVYTGALGVKQALMRNTLSSMEQLFEQKGIIKCHRSYLVNVTNIQRFHREGGIHIIQFRDSEVNIPVSNTYLKKMQKAINTLEC